MNLTQKAEKIIGIGEICDHCLGRQFARLGYGLENFERGLIIRKALKDDKKLEEALFKKENTPKLKRKEKCWLCNNIFERINYFVEYAEIALKKYDFETFLIGCKPPKKVLKNEEKLWEKVGIEYTEPIKSEINRLIGKEVSKKLKKEVNFERPDINIILDLKKERIEVVINSMFVFGRYNKLKRGLSQTRFYCLVCKGRGCEKCDFEGKKFDESVHEIIAKPLIKATKGVDTKFHGSGREDVDALCFGKRPFLIEVLEPEIRKIDLKKVQKQINKQGKGKVKVFNLRFSEKEELKDIKERNPDKIYRIIVSLEKDISKKDLEKLKDLIGVIKQRTPVRVEKRRADKVRKRKLKDIKAKKLKGNKLELIMTAEAGLYIKELVTGDEGRTKPSVSDILNQKVEWVCLDVLDVLY